MVSFNSHDSEPTIARMILRNRTTEGACAISSRRTKLLKTVATRVVTGISHCIVLFCERYWLGSVWRLCYVWWHTLFLIKKFGIELVLCDFKLYLTKFDLTKGLLFFTFFTVYKLCRCVTEYLNSNHFLYQCIGKANKTLKSNAPHTRYFYEKNMLQARYFCEKNAPREKFSNECSLAE